MSGAPRALFLDRDGVINHDGGYTHRWEQFRFVDGIFTLARAAHAREYRIVVVTNQAGIGRGLYTEDDFHALTARMCERFAQEGAPIARVYFDPTHPEHGIGAYRRVSPMRKPAPGMLLAARDALGIALADSVLVGDTPTDIEAGQRAGVRATLLYAHDDAPVPGGVAPTAVIRRLEDAVAWL